jgi:hypothetical protein
MVYIYSPNGNPTNSKLKQFDRYDNLAATHNKSDWQSVEWIMPSCFVGCVIVLSLPRGFACCAWRISPTDKHARIQRNPLAQLLADGAQKVILPNADRPGVQVISMVMAFFRTLSTKHDTINSTGPRRKVERRSVLVPCM